MIPSTERLLFGVRRALGKVRQAPPDSETASLLDAADVALNELQLRCDVEAYKNHHVAGCRLAEEASLLLGLYEMLPSANETTEQSSVDLTCFLEKAVARMGSTPAEAHRRLLNRILAWELARHARHLEKAQIPTEESPREITKDKFERYLRKKFPDRPGLEVAVFRPLPGGFSKITAFAEIRNGLDPAEPIVLRVEPLLRIMEQDGLDIRREYPIVQLAWQRGVPVAEPLWLEQDETQLGFRFFVSRCVRGATLGAFGAVDDTSVDEIVPAVAALLATLHRAQVNPTSPLEGDQFILEKWSRHQSITEANRALINYWEDQAKIGDIGPSPLVTYGFNWLKSNVPACDDAPVLVHGDLGLHNILFENGKVTALLDWEAAYIGDPAADLSYLLDPIAHIDRGKFLSLYEQAGGRAIGEHRLRFHKVMTAVRMAISAMAVLRRFHDHDEAQINWLVFGLQAAHGIASAIPTAITEAENCKA